MALKDLAKELKTSQALTISQTLEDTELPKLWSGVVNASCIDFEKVVTDKYSGYKMFFVNSNGEPMPSANNNDDMGYIWVNEQRLVSWLHSCKRALHMNSALDIDGIIEELSKPHDIHFIVKNAMGTDGIRLYNAIDFVKTMGL